MTSDKPTPPRHRSQPDAAPPAPRPAHPEPGSDAETVGGVPRGAARDETKGAPTSDRQQTEAALAKHRTDK